MHRITLLAICILFSSSATAHEPKKLVKPDRFCENAKELATVRSQLPDYKLSSDLSIPAKHTTPPKFDPFGVLSAARGQPVCIAIIVSEAGRVLDAAAYYPKRVALSKKERSQLLAHSYSPAEEGGRKVKSIVVMKAWTQ